MLFNIITTMHVPCIIIYFSKRLHCIIEYMNYRVRQTSLCHLLSVRSGQVTWFFRALVSLCVKGGQYPLYHSVVLLNEMMVHGKS